MEYDRATLLVIPRLGAPMLITPAMEAEMARRMGSVSDVREWTDGIDGAEAVIHSDVADLTKAEPSMSSPI